jgi:hypothetical protein
VVREGECPVIDSLPCFSLKVIWGLGKEKSGDGKKIIGY